MSDTMPEQQIQAYKALASAVLSTAIEDLRSKGKGPIAMGARASARRFLTYPDMRHTRELWLSWLGYTDAEFQGLLGRTHFQGLPNKTIPEKTDDNGAPSGEGKRLRLEAIEDRKRAAGRRADDVRRDLEAD